MKRAVDLHRVDREAAQVAQRRVAGAEVVEDEPDAERLELLEAATEVAVSSMSAVSVISRSSSDGSRPDSASARATDATNSGSAICAVETLTDTGTGGPPAWVHRAAWAPAARSTHSPSGAMRPDCSAIEMNSPGETNPSSGCVQRMRAS